MPTSTVAPLTTAHLLTLTLQVDFAGMLNIGETAGGRRRIAPIFGGAFEGPRLKGAVLPGGADWVINRPDGVMVIDVRITLKTDDGALIYCTYQGRFRAPPEPMARFSRGAMLADHEYMLRILARFETGAAQYAWLNDALVVGSGRQTATGPIYTLHEVV